MRTWQLTAAAVLAALVLPATAGAAVQTASNGIYNVHVQDSGSSVGRYTATTGPSHPQGANLNVLFGDGTPGTTFDSVRSFTSGTTYTQGDGGTSLGPFGAVTPLGSTGFRTTYTLPGLPTTPDAMTITQDFFIVGTTADDSRIVRSTTITNNGAVPLMLGVRYEWDYQIGEDDGPTFQQLDPDGAVVHTETEFGPPGFDTYRIVDNDGNPNPPTFAVLGTANGPTSISPAPTPPTVLQADCWPSVVGTPFDYTPSGQNFADDSGCNDTAVAYFWGRDANSALTVAPGASTSVNAQILLTTPTGRFPQPAAPPAEQPAPVTPVARDTTRPTARILGVRRRGCATRNFTISVRGRDNKGLRSVRVTLDGRRLRSTRKGKFSVLIPAKRLRSGPHSIAVTAVDSSGNRRTTRRSFTRCARITARPLPRFTG
jgi:hypothetical protein